MLNELLLREKEKAGIASAPSSMAEAGDGEAVQVNDNTDKPTTTPQADSKEKGDTIVKATEAIKVMEHRSEGTKAGDARNEPAKKKIRLSDEAPDKPACKANDAQKPDDAAANGPTDTIVNGKQPSKVPLREELKSRKYCTQKCLRGLMERDVVDPDCPNAKLHPTHEGRHQTNAETLIEELRTMLKTNFRSCSRNTNLSGSTGYLFKIGSASAGYTFVAKGTELSSFHSLENEIKIYNKLKHFQGNLIPVCLGDIRLSKLHTLEFNTHICHLMLLSYGGEPIASVSALSPEVRAAEDQIHRAGVYTPTPQARNILFNKELGGLMMIDFGRSRYLGSYDLITQRLQSVGRRP